MYLIPEIASPKVNEAPGGGIQPVDCENVSASEGAVGASPQHTSFTQPRKIPAVPVASPKVELDEAAL